MGTQFSRVSWVAIISMWVVLIWWGWREYYRLDITADCEQHVADAESLMRRWQSTASLPPQQRDGLRAEYRQKLDEHYQMFFACTDALRLRQGAR